MYRQGRFQPASCGLEQRGIGGYAVEDKAETKLSTNIDSWEGIWSRLLIGQVFAAARPVIFGVVDVREVHDDSRVIYWVRRQKGDGAFLVFRPAGKQMLEWGLKFAV